MKKFIIGVLAALGVLFILIMIMPEDEETSEIAQNEVEVSSSVQSENTLAGNSDPEDVEAIYAGTDAKSATIMVYMNGSDLETNAGEATGDMAEMLASGIGQNVNVIIQTMGTKKWQNYGISSSTAQTYRIENQKPVLVRDNLGQLDCTTTETLSEFIGFCKNNYPADRYMFIFWDHGGGPVYGFGYDEWQEEGASLNIAEMAAAFSEHSDIVFDIIGMDCCIMANMETLYALAPYCRYSLLSEDFESGLGWSYTDWMKNFEANPGMSTPLLGKNIVDDIIKDNEENYGGDSACVALFNESVARNLFDVWKAYAYKNESALLSKNYSKNHKAKGRVYPGFWDIWGYDESNVTLSDYYISDMLALVEGIDNNSNEAKDLTSALKAAVSYYGHTSDKNELTGLSVSLPYGDASFYEELKVVYKNIGFDDEYIEWLSKFVSSQGYNNYYDYNSFEDNWGGWGYYESEYGGNYSNGNSCEYGYDYGYGNGYGGYGYGYGYDNHYGDEDEYAADDWIYDYEEEIWYLYENGTLYLYDDETDTMYYYDEDTDEMYYYDERMDDWYLAE